MPENEYQNWQIEVLNECYRVLKPTGSLLYNHKNRIKNGISITPYEWILKTNFIVKQEIVWINGTPNFDKSRFYPFTERVYWLAKSPDTRLVNVLNKPDVFFRSEWKPVGTQGKHTRAFPLKMVEDLLSVFPESDIVLDPFMGSGTVAIACRKKKKKWIGIEIRKEYCELIKEKLQMNDLPLLSLQNT
jgi:DNA modification methylase